MQISLQGFIGLRVVALSLVDTGDAGHIVLCQGEIKEVDVVFDVLRVAGTQDHDAAGLDVPAENDLRVALVIFLRQLCKDGFANQRLVAVAERMPRPTAFSFI